MARRAQPAPCGWCGREVADAGLGRRRRYCRQSCRQRAYERRSSVTAAAPVAADAVVLTAGEAAGLSDRIFTLRCAAEDVATAVDEGAERGELRALCEALLSAAKAADGWR